MNNFQKRVLSSIIGGALMIAILVLGNEILLGGLCIVSIIGFFELTKACKVHTDEKKINSYEAVGICATVIWYAVIESYKLGIISGNCLTGGFIVIVLTLVAYMAVYVFSFPKYDAAKTMSALFAFIYCPVMISFIYMIRMLGYGAYLVWMVFVCSWFCDIFAYLVGVKIGKHKFVPKLSPKKSLEGAIGGVIGSAVIGGLYAFFLLAPQIDTMPRTQVVIVIIVISCIGAMISMVGDLAASAIKRNHDIKDYGKLIPGHGGIMDRFDSVIFVAPLVYMLSLLFLNYTM